MDDDLNKLFPHLSSQERPFECTECRKKVQVVYTEVVKGNCTQTVMCQDCPELQKRLYGLSQEEAQSVKTTGAGLCCGECGTTLSSVRTGHMLGCSECYEVFADVIQGELLSERKVPERVMSAKSGVPMHIGRTPGKGHEMNTSLKLLALNEALNETLAKEDYEQAALLRDQIKQLTEKSDDQKE